MTSKAWICERTHSLCLSPDVFLQPFGTSRGTSPRGGTTRHDPLARRRSALRGFAVNGHAVREAFKRLQQAGLVQVAQGGATRVLDWRRSAELDLPTSLVAVA